MSAALGLMAGGRQAPTAAVAAIFVTLPRWALLLCDRRYYMARATPAMSQSSDARSHVRLKFLYFFSRDATSIRPSRTRQVAGVSSLGDAVSGRHYSNQSRPSRRLIFGGSMRDLSAMLKRAI